MKKGDIFAFYKPKGITSHDAINLIRKETGERKVGHAGTLDPLARGVLVIAIGREATQKLGLIEKQEKEYKALLRLGISSTTDDEEGEKKENTVKEIPQLREIENILKDFEGEISQVPPIYSAIKIKGKAAYKYAREGKSIQLKPRQVFIKEIKVLEYAWPFLKLRMVTGPGVYVRSFARDLGEKLGVGGYLADLERTRVGKYRA